MATPFTIHIPDDRLVQIRRKIDAYDRDLLPDAEGWTSGVGKADPRRLVSKTATGVPASPPTWRIATPTLFSASTSTWWPSEPRMCSGGMREESGRFPIASCFIMAARSRSYRDGGFATKPTGRFPDAGVLPVFGLNGCWWSAWKAPFQTTPRHPTIHPLLQ